MKRQYRVSEYENGNWYVSVRRANVLLYADTVYSSFSEAVAALGNHCSWQSPRPSKKKGE